MKMARKQIYANVFDVRLWEIDVRSGIEIKLNVQELEIFNWGPVKGTFKERIARN